MKSMLLICAPVLLPCFLLVSLLAPVFCGASISATDSTVSASPALWETLSSSSGTFPYDANDQVRTQGGKQGSKDVRDPAVDANYEMFLQGLPDVVRGEIQQKRIPAFSLAIVADGKILYSEGFGFQDADKKVPATGKSIYRVGSISKLLTDVALMQLVQEGKANLDAPVQDYLPDFGNLNSESSAKITLRQLTQHRAGIVREAPIGHYFDPTEPTLESTVASLKQTPQIYPVGSRTKYSNAGVSVVGLAVQELCGQSHPDFVQQRILQPLGMDHTSFRKEPQQEHYLASGWMIGYDRPAFAAPEFLLGTGPAGNLYSSVEDLAKFSLFVMGQSDVQLLDSQLLEEMTTPGKSETGQDLPYGIGFHVSQYLGHKRIGHGGAVYGYSTQLEILPDAKLAVIAASSLDGTNSLVTRICDHVLASLLASKNGQPLPKYQTTSPVDRTRADQLVGYYRSTSEDNPQTIEIDWIGDRVLLWQGTFEHEIRSLDSDGRLVVDDVFRFGDEVSFVGDNLKIGRLEYSRLASQLPEPASSEISDLIGEYGWDHNTLYILERHGQLYALIEWFYYYPLTKVAKDRYAFPDYGLYHGEELIFHRDPKQNVDAVNAAQVNFVRRNVGTVEGETFKIKRELPVEQLREQAANATPPSEVGDFKNTDLVELAVLDPTIKLDIRYATSNNFMDTVFYQQARAFAQRPAAEAAATVNQQLKQQNLGLLIHDAYRPWSVTKMFWDATPDSMKDFVANPAKGSRHNRGCALDLTLYDTRSGQVIPMVSGYDEFSQRSYPLYPGGTQRQRWYRGLLRRTMESNGFQVYEFEWWHFDLDGWENYRIGNLPFEEIK